MIFVSQPMGLDLKRKLRRSGRDAYGMAHLMYYKSHVSLGYFTVKAADEIIAAHNSGYKRNCG